MTMIVKLYLSVFVLLALTYEGAEGQKVGTCVRKKQCGMGQEGGAPAATNAPTAPPTAPTNAPSKAPPTNAPTAAPTGTIAPTSAPLDSTSDVLKKEVPTWSFGSEVSKPDTVVNIAAKIKFSDEDANPMPVADGLPLFTSGKQSGKIPASSLPCFYSPSSCMAAGGFTVAFWTRNDNPTHQMNLITTGEFGKIEGMSVTTRGQSFWISTGLLKSRFNMYTNFAPNLNPRDWFLVTITVTPDGTAFYFNDYKLGGKSQNKHAANISPNKSNKIDLNKIPPAWDGSPVTPKPAQIQIGNIYEFNKVLDEKAVKTLYAAGPLGM